MRSRRRGANPDYRRGTRRGVDLAALGLDGNGSSEQATTYLIIRQLPGSLAWAIV